MHSVALLFPTLLPLSLAPAKNLQSFKIPWWRAVTYNDIKIIKSRIATVKILFNTVTMQIKPHNFPTSAKSMAWTLHQIHTNPRIALVSYKSKMIHHKAFCFELITIKTLLSAHDVPRSQVFAFIVCVYVFEKSLLSFELWLTDFTTTCRHH